MKSAQVEGICPNLSPLFKNTIRSKILKRTTPPQDYDFGEALLFWAADLLTGTHLLTSDQLRVWLEEFTDGLMAFGVALELAWDKTDKPALKRLPMCKIGFLDRRFACMDGQSYFLDLKSGDRVPATDTWPLETIVFNLTALFVKYDRACQSNSAELRDQHAHNEHPRPDHRK